MVAVTTASFIPDAGSAERPRVLLADDHPAMLALTADVLASGNCWSCLRSGQRSPIAPSSRPRFASMKRD